MRVPQFATTLFCGLLSIYFTASILVYCFKKNRNCGAEYYEAPCHHNKRLNFLLSLSLFCLILRNVTDMLLSILSCRSPTICTVYDIISGVFFQVSSGALFLLVWLRMRWFYSHPVMNLMRTRCVRFWSIAVLVLLIVVVLSLGPTMVLVAKPYYETTDCLINLQNFPVANFKPFSSFLYMVTFQLAVLLLLILPMCGEKKGALDAAKRKIKIAVKRLIISTVVCLVVNQLGVITVYVFYRGVVIWINIVNSLFLLLNILAVVFSFRDWRERLTFFLIRTNES